MSKDLYPHDPAQSRYERDPAFNALVNNLQMYLHQHQFSPSELREAVILAATRYELTVCRPMLVMSDGEIREFMWRTGRDPEAEKQIDQAKYVEAILANPEAAAEMLRERNKP